MSKLPKCAGYRAHVTGQLRQEVGLEKTQELHPPECIFFPKQDLAVAHYKRLLEGGRYTRSQLGIFAREISGNGQRMFIVDTYAGFALESSPDQNGDLKRHHMYELILQDEPCWLYFDLEFSREANPELDERVAMAAFRETLRAFFLEKMGAVLDVNQPGYIEMESSSRTKFSKHVLVKQLSVDGNVVPLALENNAQAGLLVAEFTSFVRAHREAMARHLFVKASKGECPDLLLIDEGVYTRNRSFRVLFHKKFGKEVALALPKQDAKRALGRAATPALQLLLTLVSYVPANVASFRHALLPEDYRHADVPQASFKRPRTSCDSGAEASDAPSPAALDAVALDNIYKHVAECWDSVRACNEPEAAKSAAATVIRGVKVMDEQFQAVSLGNNRYCLCKSASHKSNGVYLVLDLVQRTYHQKCFDPDCKHYRGPPFSVPDLYFAAQPSSQEDMEESHRTAAGGA
eukprot:TRINITY_DN39358_c0_g1_i1.p1 TRINITY_DN39358_c0_g1~~TRINITY_DN39358_c0_g1_i1.p1  ORF type:complete len:462 (-),score=110.96 TRINITY_DN39358_c0_g1_i1:400-1785(-)